MTADTASDKVPGLTRSDLKILATVHPDLQRVVRMAASKLVIRFRVIEGARTVTRQRALLKLGATRTLNSRHLVQPNGYAHAVDLAVLVGARVSWEVPLYHRLHDVMRDAFAEAKVPYRWGGDWDGDGDSSDNSFFDGPHYELPVARYPGTVPSVLLQAPQAGPSPRDLETLVPGSTGPRVRRLQEALAAIVGGFRGVDGVYGPRTRAAVLAATALVGKPTDIVIPSVLDRLERLARAKRKETSR